VYIGQVDGKNEEQQHFCTYLLRERMMSAMGEDQVDNELVDSQSITSSILLPFLLLPVLKYFPFTDRAFPVRENSAPSQYLKRDHDAKPT
jgi:hypothetical protein